MTYTIEQLDEAIEDESTEWEGNWGEFEDLAERTFEYREVPEGTEGAAFHRYSKVWKKRFDLDVPGVAIPGIGQAVAVDRFGGEGEGDDYWFVFKVTEPNGNERIFKRNGWYASYDGGYYEGPTEEVVEGEKVIRVWEKI